MAKPIEELLARRPVDRIAVDAYKKRMVDEVRAYRLRELREASGLMQVAGWGPACQPEQGVPHRAR